MKSLCNKSNHMGDFGVVCFLFWGDDLIRKQKNFFSFKNRYFSFCCKDHRDGQKMKNSKKISFPKQLSFKKSNENSSA